MAKNFFKLAASACILLSSVVQAAPKPTDTDLVERGYCASDNGGVHIIAARGSTEPPGEGTLSTVSGMIKAGIPGSTSMGVNYPASLENYPWSVGVGTHSLNHEIAEHVRRCPRSRIVLLGYSQGGQVVMNSLCGTNEANFAPTRRLPRHLWKHIAAVLVYADPSHVTGKVYDVGTSTLNGMFPRVKPDLCEPFRNRIQAYCDYNDPYCASGSDGYVHTSYFNKYNSQASQWLITKARRHMPWLHPNRRHRHHRQN